MLNHWQTIFAVDSNAHPRGFFRVRNNGMTQTFCIERGQVEDAIRFWHGDSVNTFLAGDVEEKLAR